MDKDAQRILMNIERAIIVLLAIMISIPSACPQAYAGGPMEPLYDLKAAGRLEPEMYPLERNIDVLFPVARDNALGTNDINNAITILTFGKDHIQYHEYFEDAFNEVGGGGQFIPPVSKDVIGFGQTRRFVFYNFKTGKHQRFRICYPLEESIEKIAIGDSQRRRFIFKITKFPKSSAGTGDDYTSLLRLMDLSGNEAKLIKELSIERGSGWTQHGEKVLVFKLDKLKVLTNDFQPSSHPIENIYSKYKGRIDIIQLTIHPFLPFAVMVDRRKDTVIASWNQDRTNTNELINISTGSTQHFQFSPDGKWVVFKEGYSDKIKIYIMPVSDKYPHYLGYPMLLSDYDYYDNATAWTTNPISFNGSNSAELDHWDLTSQAHPEGGKAAFHDFVVGRDLERMKKSAKK